MTDAAVADAFDKDGLTVAMRNEACEGSMNGSSRRSEADPMGQPTWTGRSTLSRILAGLFGGLLGTALCLMLVLKMEVDWWLLYLSIPFGVVAGFWKGDAALMLMLRLLGRF